MEKLTKFQKQLIKHYLLKYYEGLKAIGGEQSYLIKVGDKVEADNGFKKLELGK